MTFQTLIADTAAEWGMAGLAADANGTFTVAVNGYPINISSLEQAYSPCVLLSAPVGLLNDQDAEAMEALLAANLSPEGIQFSVLDDSAIAMTRVLPMTELGTLAFSNALMAFGQCLSHWREVFQANTPPLSPASSVIVTGGAHEPF
jgi:hypothetical protein